MFSGKNYGAHMHVVAFIVFHCVSETNGFRVIS